MAEIEGTDIYTPEEKEEAKRVARQRKPLQLIAGQERMLTLKLKEAPKEPLEAGAISWSVDTTNAIIETVPDEQQKPDEDGVYPINQLTRKVTGVTVGRANVRVTGVVNGKTVKVDKNLNIVEDNVGEDLELSEAPPPPAAPKTKGGHAEGSAGFGATRGARSSKEV